MSPTPLPQVIGISGFGGVGKTHLADLLARKHSYRIAHFADPLREMCRRMNPIIGTRPASCDDAARCLHLDVEPVRWGDLERAVGYAAAKRHPLHGAEFRATMQHLGVATREVLGADTWVNALLDTIQPGERVAIADVRFENELDAIGERFDGWHVRIHRPGVGPVNGHVSETALDGVEPDYRITNDREPEWMLAQLEAIGVAA